MKRALMLSVVGGITIASLAMAQVPGAPAPAAPAPTTPPPVVQPATPKPAVPEELKEFTLTGKISREQTQNKKGEAVTKYYLEDVTGIKIGLPTPQAKKGKKGQILEPAINLDDYVDASVKLIGKGKQIDRKGKSVIQIHSITSVEKIADH